MEEEKEKFQLLKAQALRKIENPWSSHKLYSSINRKNLATIK